MRKFSIIGYGVTTKPLVAFLNTQNIGCEIYDDKFQEVIQEDKNLFLPACNFKDTKTELTITSPGIPPYHPLIVKAKNLISEYDFFYDLLKEKPLSVWISGTNGKTTTTQMLEFLLKDKGAKSGGNIGYPLTELYLQKAPIWILETSSFMLHYTKRAIPDIYVLLPVREDHISWHGSFDEYITAKLTPLKRMQEHHIALIPQELANHKICKNTKAKIIFYTSSQALAEQMDIDIQNLVFKEPFLLDSLLALSVEKILFKNASIQSLNKFSIGEHRIEEFYDSQKRLWVDDSKGTNVDATCEAIKRYKDSKILLILGGDDKGANQEPIFELIKNLDVKIFLIGSNADKLENLAKQYNIQYHKSMELKNAISIIKQERSHKDVALLSPAAASLDQFESYKQRGEIFQQLALQV